MSLALLFIAASGHVLAPLTVTGSSFVSDLTNQDGTVSSTETNTIPYVVDRSCYRWTITVKPRRATIAIRERFTLPAVPAFWGTAPDGSDGTTRLSQAGRIAVTDLKVSTDTGSFGHGWCVVGGDPQGAHHIEVFQGKRLLKRFDFVIGDAPAMAQRQ